MIFITSLQVLSLINFSMTTHNQMIHKMMKKSTNPTIFQTDKNQQDAIILH